MLLGGGLLAALVGSAHGVKLMSKVTAIPSAVQALDLAEDSQNITLQINLKLQNIDQLSDKLMSVSDPKSADYGKYLSREEIENMFKPSGTTRKAAMSWLKTYGVRDYEDHGFYINFGTNVKTANKMMHAQFQHFKVNGISKIRTLEYSIPDDMGEHIELITPTTYLGGTRAQAPLPIVPDVDTMDGEPVGAIEARQGTGPTNCARLIEPPCLEKMYHYDGYKESATSGSRLAFGSFLNESARLEDLNLYQKAYGLPVKNFSVVLINGGLDHQDPRGSIGEANLDSQFMAAVAKSLPITQYITGGRPPFVPSLGIPDEAHNTNEPYLEYYSYLMNLTNDQLPHVISNSYGDDEQSVPREYASRVCDLIGMMGLRGITILESSGDTGVGAPCISNDGKKTPEFTPQFPATCPYITAVGGTQSYAPEVVWDASSGGFSNYFAQPSYQAAAVSHYLQKNIAPETKQYYTKFTNFSGRGFPDISAHSLSPNYLYYAARRIGYTGGTSAAVPVVAGIIGLLNDARLKAGKPAMGFINPWLYSSASSGLIDVTAGKATGCNGVNSQTGETVVGGGVIPYASWNGTEGWDPATGLGMPDFKKLMNLALNATTVSSTHASRHAGAM